MKQTLSGENVSVTLGSGVVSRMVFRTARQQKIILDPKSTGTYCIPREDVGAHPTLFVEVGPC